MSWSISAAGTPDEVVAALEKQSEELSGQSKVEYDDAMPHLIGLVRETFVEEGAPPAKINLYANGHGSARMSDPPVQLYRRCNVNLSSA